MVVIVLALIALAVTAAVVIRDAHPPAGKPVVRPVDQRVAKTAEPSEDFGAEPDVVDAPTQAIDMTQLVLPQVPAGDDLSFDQPTGSIPVPVASSAAQAAAILPYPASAPIVEPILEPAAFMPAGKPHLQPDPDRLIQTEIVIEDVARAQKLAMTRLVIGLAASGAVFGFGVIGIARLIMVLVHALSG
jgi:hypothetical protein